VLKEVHVILVGSGHETSLGLVIPLPFVNYTQQYTLHTITLSSMAPKMVRTYK